jgi:hypothetical protein
MDAERRPIDQWSTEAECRNKPTVWWFPLPPSKTGRARTAKSEIDPRAIPTCDRCPVNPECLDYSLRHMVQGIWAGRDEHDRGRLRRLAGIVPIPLVDQRLYETHHPAPEEEAS